MYLSFYNLKQKPFQISTDPKFLWLGEKHEEALATLRYGVNDNKGFLLLTGDVGTGKTTLINALLKTLNKNILVATIRDPALEPLDFYNYTAHVFCIKETFASKTPFLIQFEKFLLDAHEKGKKVLLIIDEAQRISQKLLEEVRVLSNIEREDTKLLNIFFVGQHEFNDTLLNPVNKAIRQRITINYHILPLSEQETSRYIKHRLVVAGAEEKIFTEDAIHEVYRYSQGYPRLINIICDRALLTGFVEESKIITAKHVRECASELTIPHSQKKTAINRKETELKIPTTPQKTTTQQPSGIIPQAKEKKDTRKERAVSRSYVYITTVLFLLLVSYIIVSLNGLSPLPGESILGNLQSYFKQFANERTLPSSSGVEQADRNNITSTVEKRTDPGSPNKPHDSPPLKNQEPAKEKKSANTPSKKNTKNLEPRTGRAIINPTLEIVTGSNTGVEDDRAPDLMHDDEPLHTTTEEETNQIATQEIKVQPIDTFKKLIIPFPSNSNLPPAESFEELDMLAESLLKQPQFKIIVTGFTDSQGNESFNEKLSEFRANAVKSYLVGKGIAEPRIFTIGMGSQNPIASNETYSGRMANRRVEINVER